MANNVQNVKFLRNGILFGTRDAAKAALTGLTLTDEKDGSAILARYQETGKEVKTLVGFVYSNGATKSITIFDIDDAGADVDEKIGNLRTEINNELGTGVTSANTATAQFKALSGSSSDTSGVTSVAGAKAYAKDYTDEQIGGLEYADTAVSGSYVSEVRQSDGVIAVERVALPTVSAISEAGKPITAVSESLGVISASAGTINAEYVNIADSGSLITATTVEGALAEIAAEIDAMDKAASAEDGKVVTTVSENDGVVSETKANVKDLQLGGYAKTNDTGDIASADTINVALSKLENKAAAITINDEDGSINVTPTVSGTDISVNIKSGEHVIAKDASGIYTDFDLVKITTGLPETIKERYQLIATDDSQIGANIDIPKDSHIVSIRYITTGDHAQSLEYVYIDASGATQTTYVDMSELVLEAEFASGITVTDHVAHGVVDPDSENFLSVGANGFKLTGVQTAINSAINALDVSVINPGAGKYIYAIEENDGKIAASGANVSEAVLNNYVKGSASGAVAATDTINQAIGKLENQIAGNIDALDATVSGETADGKVNVKVTETNGKITAVNVVGTDIASASALTAETAARKAVDGQNGDTYVANSGKEFISGATSLNDADIKLNDALKAEETRAKDAEAAATTEVQASTTAASSANAVVVTPTTDGTDGHTIYTIQLGTIDCGLYD